MRLFALIAFAVLSCAAVAADRQIGFVQQQPGHLDLVSLVHTGKKAVAIVHRFSAKPAEWDRSIKKEEFESIWLAFTSAAVAQFEFSPGPSDSMSDPKFYTIKIEGAKKPISLRIPVSAELSKPVADAVAQVRAWINEKG